MTTAAVTVQVSPSDFTELWESVSRLTTAGRWRDATVTLRAVAEATGSLDVRISLGTVLAESGDLYGAVSEWTRVIEPARAAADGELLAAVYHNLAAVYRDLGDRELALQFQRQALSFQTDCGAAELLQLANDALHRGCWSRAELLLEAVEDAIDSEPDRDRWSADLLATRGLWRGLQGDLAAGLRHLRAALQQHRRLRDEGAVAKDAVNLAVLLETADHPGLALLCLQQARRLAIGDPVLLNRIHYLTRHCERSRQRQRFRPEFN